MTKEDKVLAHLKAHGHATKDELLKLVKSTDQGIYGIIYAIRKKGTNVTQVNGAYSLNGVVKVKESEVKIPTDMSSRMSSLLKSKLSRLSKQDRESYFEMVQKSIFYAGSSQALLEANETVERMRNETEI